MLLLKEVATFNNGVSIYQINNFLSASERTIDC